MIVMSLDVSKKNVLKLMMNNLKWLWTTIYIMLFFFQYC